MAEARAFVEDLGVCILEFSLGGVETLAEHTPSTSAAPLSDAGRAEAGHRELLDPALSVGLESADGLIADLAEPLVNLSRDAFRLDGLLGQTLEVLGLSVVSGRRLSALSEGSVATYAGSSGSQRAARGPPRCYVVVKTNRSRAPRDWTTTRVSLSLDSVTFTSTRSSVPGAQSSASSTAVETFDW